MSDKAYDVLPHAAERALIGEDEYQSMYRRSIDDPEGFWGEMAEKNVHWFKKWDKVWDWTYDGDVSIKWFEGAKLNVSYNCLDRHLADLPRQRLEIGGCEEAVTAIMKFFGQIRFIKRIVNGPEGPGGAAGQGPAVFKGYGRLMRQSCRRIRPLGPLFIGIHGHQGQELAHFGTMNRLRNKIGQRDPSVQQCNGDTVIHGEPRLHLLLRIIIHQVALVYEFHQRFHF